MSDPVEDLRQELRGQGCACNGKCVNPETGERNSYWCPSEVRRRQEWRERYPEALRRKYGRTTRAG